MVSDIPFRGPIGCVRVGLDADGQFILNPSFPQQQESPLDLIVAASDDAIAMVEAGASEVSEEKMLEAMDFAHDACRKLCDMQRELPRKSAKPRPIFPCITPTPKFWKSFASGSQPCFRSGLQDPDKFFARSGPDASHQSSG